MKPLHGRLQHAGDYFFVHAAKELPIPHIFRIGDRTERRCLPAPGLPDCQQAVCCGWGFQKPEDEPSLGHIPGMLLRSPPDTSGAEKQMSAVQLQGTIGKNESGNEKHHRKLTNGFVGKGFLAHV